MENIEDQDAKYFSAVKKQQRRISVITTSLICVFVSVTILLLYLFWNEHSLKEKALEEKGKAIFDKKIVVDSLNNQAKTIQLLLDSVIILKNIITGYQNENNNITENDAKLSEVISNKIKNSHKGLLNIDITKLKNDITKASLKYTIYIQFTKEYSIQTRELRKQLAINTDNFVPEPEPIATNTFNPSVRYFNKEDITKAKELARIARNITGLNYEVKPVNLKAPKKQLEIWIGNYQKPTIDISNLK